MARTRVVMSPEGWKKLQLRVEQLVQQITDDVYYDAKALVPVDTGELMASLRTRYVSWKKGRVYVGTDHWSYNEYGTEKMTAQPFMRPALYRLRMNMDKVA